MPRAEYKTIIAAKSVVEKLEEYRLANSLPSNSQALAALTHELDNKNAVTSLLLQILEKIKTTMQDIKGKSGKEYQKIMSDLMELVTFIIEALTKSNTKK